MMQKIEPTWLVGRNSGWSVSLLWFKL